MHSKFFFLVLFFGLTWLVHPLFAQAPSVQGRSVSGALPWVTNYDRAMSQAKSQGRPVLLFFTGSDWCGWCKKMDQEIFSSADFKSAMGNRFVFVMVDFPMNKKSPDQAQNEALKKKYGITGFPTVVILDPNGNFVTETGYRPNGGKAFAEYLQQFIQN